MLEPSSLEPVQPLPRRSVLAWSLALAGTSILPTPLLAASANLHRSPRMRVLIDNDFGGDPDGLFQLAHFALSPSVTIPLVIGTHYKDFGAADLIPDKAAASVNKAKELLHLLPGPQPAVIAGSPRPPAPESDVTATPASAAIIREAMRGDISLPLYYAAGGSLSEIARAWQIEPRIGQRLRLLWIGGGEHEDIAKPPPGPIEPEYNFSLDRQAAQIVFNQSDIEIWQVPRNAFRQMLFGLAELEELGRAGRLGQYLHDQVAAAHQRLSENLPPFIFSEGETIMLGDTALVTLTALQSAFQPDSASSSYVVRPTPTMLEDGGYVPNPTARPMRVYSTIDAGLTFRDMLAKIRQV